MDDVIQLSVIRGQLKMHADNNADAELEEIIDDLRLFVDQKKLEMQKEYECMKQEIIELKQRLEDKRYAKEY